MKKLTLLSLAILAASAFTSCTSLGKAFIHAVTNQEDLKGVADADTVTIEKKMAFNGSFSHIKMDGAYDVKLVQSDNAIDFKGRKVYADNTIVKVSGDTLYISSKEDRFGRGNYVIAAPNVKSIQVDGASTIKAENFQQSENIDIITNGASEIEFKSSSFADLNINSSGAADVALKSVLMHNSRIIISGAGNIDAERITADTINADISGAGDIVASGHCKDFICNVNGAGDINIDKLNVANKNAKGVNNAINN